MKTPPAGKASLSLFAVLILCLCTIEQAYAQEHVVQLSGIVSNSKSEGIPGVSVYVPHTTRGTHSINNGYFSVPVLPGDTVVISAIGYESRFVLIPDSISSYSYSVKIRLQEKATELPTVNVMPWATERDLKIAISKVKLPEKEELKVDLGPLQYKSILHGPQLDAEGNADHAVQSQLRQLQNRYMITNGIRIF